ncbi:MAG: ABC transporter ATP-binding protein [Deltaproteobacteria bacterium]|nr:ABC transporter ATP-binding protein [Deltaproteobacteria bacterium]
MLEINHLFFSFGGRQILRDITATYEAGRIHGLVGPNGSGKTTLLKNICRIYAPQSGDIKLRGRDCNTMGRRRLSSVVSLVPQNPKVNFPISVYDFVLMGRHPHLKRFQSLSSHDLEVVERALQATVTAHLRERSLTELSGGEAQLVLIARALATEAKLILLDEPTSSLDIGNSLALMELLLELKKQGKTILTSVHDLNHARRFCDTMTILQDGRIYYQGPTAKAFTRVVLEEVFRVRVAVSSDLLEFQSLSV